MTKLTNMNYSTRKSSGVALFARRTLMVFGALFLFGLLASCTLMVSLFGDHEKPLPGKFVLSMTLDNDIPERQVVDNPFSAPPPTILDVVNALDRAAADKRVKGLVVDFEDAPLSLGHVQELRAAILRFRKTGKFTYIYAPSYGEPGRGLGTYYLASAFDQIWMQPVGAVSMAGISAEMPFARKLLDKHGVQPEFFQRKEYKSLFESFERNDMSPAAREEMTGLINDLGDQLVDGIAQARKTTPAAVKAFVDQGLFTDEQALAAGLVTHLDSYDVLQDKIADAVTGAPNTGKKDVKKADKSKKKLKNQNDLFVDIGRYADDTEKEDKLPAHGKTAALIYLDGTITDASASGHSAAGFADQFSPAGNVTDDILAAADDPKINAIVMRINSPGGSPAASETIRRALLRAKANGKKIIISMGDECASGGYWIASAGDRIFASAGTLTGSIGVAGGKFSLAGLWDQLGIHWESVTYGADAGSWSFNAPFSDAAAARMNEMMDSVYNAFVARVAAGRHMSVAQADAVARGRVWSGRQAKERGLVDEIGGLDAALDYTAVQLGVKDRAHLKIDVLPRPQSPFEKLEDLMDQSRLAEKFNTLLPADGKALLRAMQAGSYMTYEPVTIRAN